MRHVLSIADEVSADAADLRALLLEQSKFETVRHDGHDYTGICRWVPDGVAQIVRSMPGLAEAEIAMHFFRRQSIKDPVESWIHADGGIATMAVVWYLSPDKDCTGGTAFYRHKSTGWEAMPTQEQLDATGLTAEGAACVLYADSHEEQYWDRLMVVPARFNRMICYPAKRFHGRYPKKGFGETPEDSRLIYVAFLNVP